MTGSDQHASPVDPYADAKVVARALRDVFGSGVRLVVEPWWFTVLCDDPPYLSEAESIERERERRARSLKG